MVNRNTPAPFSCTSSGRLPELLMQLNCSLAISTYQAGKVILISAKDDQSLVLLPRTFNRAMGLAVRNDQMAIATKDEVLILANAPELAKTYPKNPGTYDALYMPRLTYYTGPVDIHDLHWGSENMLWGVNTSFSCLVQMSGIYSWTPQWKPFFIDDLVSEDRCHLNGMAMEDDMPKYVTALAKSNSMQGWRYSIPEGGVLMDVTNNEIILEDLAMPHSPRIFGETLYMLLSARGQLIAVDTNKKKYRVIQEMDGFVRGLAKMGDYLFIGISKMREKSSAFKHLELARKADNAGIVAIHLPTGAVAGELTFHASVDEIYDVQVLPGVVRPGILNTTNPIHKYGLSLPDATFWASEIPEEK